MLALAAQAVGPGLLLDEGLALDQVELLLEVLDLAGQTGVVEAEPIGPVDRGAGVADLPGEDRHDPDRHDGGQDPGHPAAGDPGDRQPGQVRARRALDGIGSGGGTVALG